MVSLSWIEPPENGFIEFQNVHVWRMRIDLADYIADEWLNMLSADEIQRANKFRSREDRSRFITAHFRTRQILGHYLGRSPEKIVFAYNQYGKPEIAGKFIPHNLRFNLSHSVNIGLLAVSNGLNVGIDVEQVKPDKDLEGIAKRFFSPNETNLLRKQPADKYPEGFFRIWTRKEAYIKARGEGMSFPLDHFEVNFLPGEEPKITWIKDEPDPGEQWSLFQLQPGDGFTGALAVEGKPKQVVLYSWGK